MNNWKTYDTDFSYEFKIEPGSRKVHCTIADKSRPKAKPLYIEFDREKHESAITAASRLEKEAHDRAFAFFHAPAKPGLAKGGIVPGKLYNHPMFKELLRPKGLPLFGFDFGHNVHDEISVPVFKESHHAVFPETNKAIGLLGGSTPTYFDTARKSIENIKRAESLKRARWCADTVALCLQGIEAQSEKTKQALLEIEKQANDTAHKNASGTQANINAHKIMNIIRKATGRPQRLAPLRKQLDDPEDAHDWADEAILGQADDLVNGDRQADYGHPVENYTHIAKVVTSFLRSKVTPEEMAVIMVIVKLCRSTEKYKRDNFVDAAGYLKIANMCALKNQEGKKS